MAICGQPTYATICSDSPSCVGISSSVGLKSIQGIGRRPSRSWGSVVLKPPKWSGQVRGGNGAAGKVLRVVAQAKSGNSSPAKEKNSKVLELVPDSVRTFPWQQVSTRFGERIFELLWVSCGWLLLPIIAVSALSEVSYAMVHNKEFLVPIGLVVGSAVAGVVKETALEYSAQLQDKNVPWHLVISALLFLLVKLPGASYPYWARCFMPHIGTGGLWQTWLYWRAWRQQRHGAAA